MPSDLIAAASFILITTFSPGPNNISSAAMGALHGYRQTRRYLLGVTGGVLIVFFACALVSATLLNALPQIEVVLRIAGAVYILYLAYSVLKASYSFERKDVPPLGFASGFLLQLLNPKLIIYGLTLFSTFLAPAAAVSYQLIVVVVVLALVSFFSVSVWALFGTLIHKYLNSPRAQLIINVCLSLFLVYTALELAQVL